VTAPTVIVSSLDPTVPLPRVTGAVKVADAARASGWRVRMGYSKVSVPDRLYANGELAKAAHTLECVGVWLRRGVIGGWAIWHRVDGAGWRFDNAFIGITRHGARSIIEAVRA